MTIGMCIVDKARAFKEMKSERKQEDFELFTLKGTETTQGKNTRVKAKADMQLLLTLHKQ